MKVNYLLAVVLLFGITKSEALDVSEFKDPCEKAKCKKVEQEEEVEEAKCHKGGMCGLKADK